MLYSVLMLLVALGADETPDALAVERQLDPSPEEPRVQQWRVCRVHPWVEADALQLPHLLTEPAKRVSLSGPRNDWLTGAFAIAADADTVVTVGLRSPAPLEGRIQLRVVGQVRERERKRVVWDPLFGAEDIAAVQTNARYILNSDYIKDFPRLRVAPDVPAFLWLTVDLRGVDSGKYAARVSLTDDWGNHTTVPVEVTVLDAELPVRNPLCAFAWQWNDDDPEMLRDLIEHGVNVFHVQHEAAWKAGARFLLFFFRPSWRRELPIDDEKRAGIAQELDRIWQLTERLEVPLDRWAITLADEVSDKTARTDLAYAQEVRKLRSDTPILFNPSWGKAADTNQNWTTPDGTINVIAPETDVWLPYSWHLWDGSGALELMRATGKPMWFYEIEGSVTRRPEVGRGMLRRGPWYAWKYRLQGFCVYALNDWKTNGWDDTTTPTPRYSFTYPKNISSRGFEALRQGFQEYKRLHRLHELGCGSAILDAWTQLATSHAHNVRLFDTLREAMDKKLVELTARAPSSPQPGEPGE